MTVVITDGKNREMRVLYPLLIAATIGSAVWCVALYATLPIGVVDRFYVIMKSELVEHEGAQDGRPIFAQVSQTIVDGVRATIVATAVPLLLTNFAWGYLAYQLSKKSGES